MMARARSHLVEVKAEWKMNGSRAVFQKFGWRFVALIFTTYLVRDVAIYIVLPWLVARHLVLE